ncbi:Na-translocating system protein MpsC family protein [Halalkalibacter oceani]|uniref:DUF2294 domain-containing protein n=1 Tax=Halalkalibacter oceani TaxID=1653776 RepID=A0A9X2IM27_9BACI|nr:Na-translocating system protein MpsC family protein [Halalkalibacter oceani]MCM3713464.1 DUF2294 domain-containing protein [Halalkalibacter oceani]
METKKKQVEIASRIGKVLRDHFGKGPEGVFVSISEPFVTIFLRRFIAPMEQVLLEQNDLLTIQQTRDKMMDRLLPEIAAIIEESTGVVVDELYYDWTLEQYSGLLCGISHQDADRSVYTYPNSELVNEEVGHITKKAEKLPDQVASYLLNPRTLVIIRHGILVEIEKELIELGFEEQLTLAKRRLEKALLTKSKEQFEIYLEAQVEDIFVNWDFHADKSIIVFILTPNKL